MRRIMKNMVSRLRKSEKGFTLVELLVVVGIIVALAAVIIPNVSRFTGKGTEGAMDAEMQNVQAAMDTMMADKGITTVTASVALAAATNDFATKPTGDALADPLDPDGGYLRTAVTNYFYCWGANGLISTQFETGGTC